MCVCVCVTIHQSVKQSVSQSNPVRQINFKKREKRLPYLTLGTTTVSQKRRVYLNDETTHVDSIGKCKFFRYQGGYYRIVTVVSGRVRYLGNT